MFELKSNGIKTVKPNGKEIGLNTYFISFMIDVAEGRIINLEFEKKFEELKLDKSKAVFVMCKSGFRSFKAAELMFYNLKIKSYYKLCLSQDY